MKAKKTIETKLPLEKQALVNSKPKSLRPMRSMVAVRSLKSKTVVATMVSSPSLEKQDNA